MPSKPTAWLFALLLGTLALLNPAKGFAFNVDNDPILSNGLIAHWSLDETTGTRADSRGNYPLTPNGIVASGTGKFGNAAAPTEGNSLTSALNYSAIPHSFTISFWFKRTVVDDTPQNLILQWFCGGWVASSINPTVWASLPEVRNRIGFSLGHDGLDRVFSSPITDTDWHLITLQWIEGAKIRIGVDNSFNEKLVSEFPENPPYCTNTNVGLAIGKSDFDTDAKQYRVDELCVWNRALSDTELTTLYNSTAYAITPASPVVKVGGGVTLSATSGALSYQWQKDGMDLPGQTASTLTLNPVQAADSGSYTCRMVTSNGTVISQPAILQVDGGTNNVPNALDNDPILSNGLIAHWSLDETSGIRADSRGNFPLSPNGIVPIEAGKFGNAAAPTAGNSLSSTLNYGDIAHSFTISFWFKRDPMDDSWQFLLHQWYCGGWVCVEINPPGQGAAPSEYQNRIRFPIYQNRIRFALGHDALDSVISPPIPDSAWHFITLQWLEGSKLRIGVDNVFTEKLVSQFPENPPQCTNAIAGLSIGKSNYDSGPKHFAVDELCVWNRALSDTELTTLYNWGAGFNPGTGISYAPLVWKELKGNYSGVFSNPQVPDSGSSGLVTLSTASGKRFTGKFDFGGSSSSFLGRFDEQGNASVEVKTRSSGVVRLNLHLSMEAGVARVSGMASGANFASTPILLTREQTVPRNSVVTLAGLYNFAISAESVDGEAPVVVGQGTVLVKGNGTTKLLTTLFDGTKISLLGKINEEASWPFYTHLYANQGSLGGLITFDEESSTCSGTLYWSKPETKSKIYPAPISSQLILSGTGVETLKN